MLWQFTSIMELGHLGEQEGNLHIINWEILEPPKWWIQNGGSKMVEAEWWREKIVHEGIVACSFVCQVDVG